MAITAPSPNVGTSVMFENDRVRVWDQVIPPNGICEKHVHRTSYFYIVVDGGLIRFVNPDDPSEFRDVRFRDGQVGYHEIAPGVEKIDNRLVSIGQTYRAIVVELKPEPAGGYDRTTIARGAAHGSPTPPSEDVGTKQMFENDRIRVWDLALAPGEQLAKHIHRVDNFYVVISGGLIRFENPDDSTDYRDVQFQDDQVTWVNVPPEGKIDNRLTNIGTKAHRNFLIELLR
jgi:mannose-6-phosphate isomerase-like protein (cupin superfamily)